MAFRVEVLPSARLDIVETVDHIALDSTEAARRWYEGLWKAIFELADRPRQYSIIPEAAELSGGGLRHCHYHSHRLVFRIREDVIEVLRIYHGARRALHRDDLA